MQTFIRSFINPWDAQIARGLLESEGLPATLEHENIVRNDWMQSLAVGGVRLVVPEEYAAAARDVLARHDAGEFEEALEAELALPAAVCQRCGSRSLRPVRSARWVLGMLLAFVSIGLLFPPRRKGVICKKCGHGQRDTL